MHTKYLRTTMKLAIALMLVVGLFSIGHTQASAACAPTVTFELWAKTGTIDINGTAVPVWGYALTDTDPVSVPGPAIVVNQGDCVAVNLNNNLPEASSLYFTGQSMAPDLSVVPTNATWTYSFLADQPGTYLYQAGLLANFQHQVAMGLYGTIIVQSSTPGTAYGTSQSAFTKEALVVLSEIDPALNNSADPAAFDIRDFAPKYFLINGKAYPGTDPILVQASDQVLLRYVNAGLLPYSMGLLGIRQTQIAMDGSPLTYGRTLVAETIAPGETADMLIAIPPTAADGTRYTLFNNNLYLHNNTANNVSGGFGGMVTFLTVGTTPPPGSDITGPVASGLSLSPNPSNGTVDVLLSASISDLLTGGANIQAAEFYIDSTAGAATAMSALDGAFDSSSEVVQGTISSAVLSGLTQGMHTVYVRGQDSLGNWGGFNYTYLYLDQLGPVISALSLSPNPTNGTVNAALSATASETSGATVAAAEYFIDATGSELPGSGTAMVVSPANVQTANLSASIPASVINALSIGSHAVGVRGLDSLGNWGDMGFITLVVDKTGPVTSNAAVNPSPNNGTLGINSSTSAVRVTALFTDDLAAISAGEGFIDAAGVNGSGFIFKPSDGSFNTASESGYADVPLTTINTLSEGSHSILIHGKDSAGNWGALTSVTLVIDKTRPVVSGVSASPNPTNTTTSNNTGFTLSASASDAATGNSVITRAEWFEGADPGAGNGTAMAAADGIFDSSTEALTASINFLSLGWTPGNHTVSVRARDAAGNWGTAVSTVVNVVMPNNIFADSFASGSTSAWSSTTGANVSVTPTASLNGTPSFGMQVTLAGNTPGYVTDLTPFVDPSYHARFYFNPNSVLPANNNSANGITIFSGLNSANTAIFQVQFRRQNAGGGTYQVRLAVLRAGGTTTTSWYNISNASHSIEIAWLSGTSASAAFYTDGVLRQTLTGLNTSAYLLEAVRLGPSAGIVNGAAGTMYFDALVSTRNTIVGP